MNKPELIKKIKDIDALSSKEKAALIELINHNKRYGLVWENKTEDAEELLRDSLPVVKEVIEKRIEGNKDDGNCPNHVLIEGDNLHALTALSFTHESKIDIIYIDPPYNTGATDWKYNNDYVDTLDAYRHSKWIAMMNRRLKIAKKLLKNDGVMIVAIDDNEFASLSLLLEEIFPHKTQNTVVIVNNPHGVARSGFSRCHEYAIFLLNKGQTINKKAAAEDVRNINLRRSGNNSLREDSPTMFYPIFVNKTNLEIIGVGEVPDKNFHPTAGVIEFEKHYEVWPVDAKGIEKNWYYSRKRVEERGNEELKCKIIKSQIVISFYHSNNGQQVYKSFWANSEYDSGAYGASVVKEIAKTNFPFPKSIYTVLDCLKAVTKAREDIILDFFAGSGTTLHATMQLNAEDGGNRQCILVTNNENNICEEVTYERNKRVIEGYTNGKGEKVPGLTENNLRYFKTVFIGRERSLKNKRKLTELAVDLLRIKEDCFTEIKGAKHIRIFNESELYVMAIADDIAIPSAVELIQALPQKSRIKVYVFSEEQDPYAEDFYEVLDRVELCALPDAIYKAYQHVLPKKKTVIQQQEA